MKNIKIEDRAYRGGSWRYAAWGSRASYRYGLDPSNRGCHLGFRVVLSPPQRPLPSSVLTSNGFPPGSSSARAG